MATSKTANKPAKTAAKGKPAAAKASGKAKKASTTAKAVAPAKPIKLLEVGSFATFTGYKTDIGDDAVFKTDEKVYIVEVTPQEGDKAAVYTAVDLDSIETYLANPEDEDVRGGEVGVNEVTQIKGSEEVTLREKHVPIKLVGRMGKLLESHDGDKIAIAKGLYESAQEDYFYLGGVIAMILQDGSYLKENGGDYEGDDAFNQFCVDTFGFEQGKGRDLARIYTTFAAMPEFKPEMLKKVGWSNARAIQRYATNDNLEEVIELAAEKTQRELPMILKERFVGEGNTTPSGAAATRATVKKSTLTFKLLEDAASGITMTIQAVMKTGAYKDESSALEHIVMTYAQEHLGDSQAGQRAIKKFAKVAKADTAKADNDAGAKPAAAGKVKPKLNKKAA